MTETQGAVLGWEPSPFGNNIETTHSLPCQRAVVGRSRCDSGSSFGSHESPLSFARYK